MDFSLLFSIEFIILSVLVNCLVSYFKSIVLGFRKNKPLKFQSQILQAMVFSVSLLATYGAHKFGQLTVYISESWIFTSFWVAILSVIIYEIGLKHLFVLVKALLGKKIEKAIDSDSSASTETPPEDGK